MKTNGLIDVLEKQGIRSEYTMIEEMTGMEWNVKRTKDGIEMESVAENAVERNKVFSEALINASEEGSTTARGRFWISMRESITSGLWRKFWYDRWLFDESIKSVERLIEFKEGMKDHATFIINNRR